MRSAVLSIARREMRGYFDSPVAYIVIVAFLLLAGWLFFSAFFLIGLADMRPFFQPISMSTFVTPAMALLIIVPAVSMRLIAEEKRTGTIELITTLPIPDAAIIFGKFLGAFGLLFVAIGLTLIYPITVSFIGDLDWGPVIAGYVGLLLYSASLLAIGLLCSTATRDQIVAFIISFAVCAGLYFIYMLQFFMPDWLGEIVSYISLSSHLESISRGVIDTRDVLYYLTVIVGSIFLSIQTLRQQHA